MKVTATCRDCHRDVEADSTFLCAAHVDHEYHFSMPCPLCGRLIIRQITRAHFEQLRAEGASWTELRLSSHPAGSDL